MSFGVYLIDFFLDIYNLYALIVFFRADTDKVSEYVGAIEQIVTYLETPVLENELAFNIIRKILQVHVSEAERDYIGFGQKMCTLVML